MNKTKIRALFFDVDGTLVGYRSHKINPDDLESLKKLRDSGYLLFIASGRDLFIPIEAKAIETLAPYMDGFISANGQRCHLSSGEIISFHPLLPEDVIPICQICEKEHIPILYYIEHESYITEFSEKVKKFSDYVGIPYPSVRPIDPGMSPPQKMCIYIDPADEKRLLQPILKHTITARSSDDLIDLIPAGIGKDTGIREICDWFGIDIADTMAFGDGENDIPMMKAAGLSIAMGNADERVKNAADYVTKTTEEAGITLALKHFGIL